MSKTNTKNIGSKTINTPLYIFIYAIKNIHKRGYVANIPTIQQQQKLKTKAFHIVKKNHKGSKKKMISYTSIVI